MFKRIVNILVVLLLALFATSVVHATIESELPVGPLYVSSAILPPAGMTAEAVRKAVRKSMFLNDWQILDVDSGHSQGKFIKLSRGGEKYRIEIDVMYDAKSVNIKYKNSSGLNYSNGLIHNTYGSRIKALEKRIRAELGAF